MANKPQSMPVFGDAYLADTTHLSTEEHGAYFLLLLAAWRQDDCALPNDDRKLARIAGVSAQKWRSMRPTLMEFWTVEGDRIHQSRQRKERAWVNENSRTNRTNAVKGWEKRKAQAGGRQELENKGKGASERNAEAMPNASESDAPPPPPPPPPIGEESLTGLPPMGQPDRKPAKGKTACPVDFKPSPSPGSKTAERMADWSPEHLQLQIEKFIAYHRSKDNRSASWQQAWTTWALNDYDRKAPRNERPRSHGNGLLDACLEDGGYGFD